MPIRVLVADDHPVVREGLRTMLCLAEDIEVVAEAADGMEAVEKVSQHQPQVVVMDWRMPKLDGVEAARRIKAQLPSIAIILLTMYDSQDSLLEAVRAGVDSYLSKESSSELLLHAIRAVTCGGMLVKEGLLRETIIALAQAVPSLAKEPPGLVNPGEHLTRRELDVLRLLVEGQSNKQIGLALSISDETAKKHVQSLILKLGVSHRTQVAVKAVRAGLVGTPL